MDIRAGGVAQWWSTCLSMHEAMSSVSSTKNKPPKVNQIESNQTKRKTPQKEKQNNDDCGDPPQF